MSEAVALGEALIGFFLTRSCRPSTNRREADDKDTDVQIAPSESKRTGPKAGVEPEVVWDLRDQQNGCGFCPTDHIYQRAAHFCSLP